VEVILPSPPLACLFGMSRLHFTYIPPVSYHILGIPCIPVSIIYLSILQQIHCIPLYPTVSSCIRTYLAVSRCISPYPTASKMGHGQKYTPGEGFACYLVNVTGTSTDNTSPFGTSALFVLCTRDSNDLHLHHYFKHTT